MEKKVIIDIETFHDIFYLGVYDADNDDYFGFQISNYKNELDKLIGWYTGDKWDRSITYNGIGFDIPVIEYILDNYYVWDNKSGLEIARIISNYAQKTIDNKNYGIVEYRETNFTKPTYDVFTILGLNNENRFTSLKTCEIYLNMDSIEELPYSFDSCMTEQMCQELIDYCKNDLIATWEVFNQLVCGNTNNPYYKGVNILEMRTITMEETGIDCLNMSDITLGDTLLKKGCADKMSLTTSEFQKKIKGFFRKEIKLKHCIPSFIKFKHPVLKEALKIAKNTVINPNLEKQYSYEFTFDNTTYTLGLGGGHSANKNEEYHTDDIVYLSDLDTQSQYPATATIFKYFPFHLKDVFGSIYSDNYYERLRLKPLAKTDKKIKGKVDSLKLILNAPTGKFRDKTSWMFDAQAAIAICLTSQFVLLYLIEKLHYIGIRCFSFNTKQHTLVL